MSGWPQTFGCRVFPGEGGATVSAIVAELSNRPFEDQQLSTDQLLMRDFLRFFDRLSRLTIWFIN
jgi:hypothetical protein